MIRLEGAGRAGLYTSVAMVAEMKFLLGIRFKGCFGYDGTQSLVGPVFGCQQQVVPADFSQSAAYCRMFQGKKSHCAGLAKFLAGCRVILMDLNRFVSRDWKRQKPFILKHATDFFSVSSSSREVCILLLVQSMISGDKRLQGCGQPPLQKHFWRKASGAAAGLGG